MQHEEQTDPRLRVKRQVIKLGRDFFYTSNLLRMRVTCEERQVSMKKVGGTVMAGGMVTTNGKQVNFHPQYVQQVDDARIAYHLKKAVLQVALKHHLVRDKYPDMDPKVISLASSLAINHILMHEDGIPEDAPIAGTPGSFFEYLNEGKAMEHYVEALQEMAEQQQQQQQQESKDGSGQGKDGSGQTGGRNSKQDKSGKSSEEDDAGSPDPDGSESRDDGDQSSDDDGESDSGDADDSDSDDGMDGDPKEGDDDQDDDDGSELDEPQQGKSDGKDDVDWDWDKLPDKMDAGDVEQHPEMTPGNAESMRDEMSSQVAASIAACADGRGDVPAELKEMYEESLKPSKMDYRTMLRRFASSFNSRGFTYQKPNRRHSFRRDVIMPCRHNRGISNLVFAVDTSGSMDSETINRALDEIEGVIKSWPNAKVTMIECSETITAETQVSKFNMASLKKDKEWSGRGGTDLRPPFKRAAEMGDVKCIIYLTDLMGPKPDAQDVRIPTLWLVAGQDVGTDYYNRYIDRYKPEFGIVVPMEKD